MEIMSDFINNSKTLSHVMYRIHRNGTVIAYYKDKPKWIMKLFFVLISH